MSFGPVKTGAIGLAAAALCAVAALWGSAPRPPEEPEVVVSELDRLLQRAAKSQWPIYQGGGGLQGRAAALPLEPMAVRWRYKLYLGGESSPVISDGVVYICGAEGSIHAVDVVSGEEVWQLESDVPVSATPLVSDGRVFYGDAEGVFRCFSTDGVALWTFEAGRDICCSANVATGKLVFSCDDSAVYCLDPVTGKEAWRLQTEGMVRPTPAVSAGAAFFGGCDRYVRAVDAASGDEMWCAAMHAAVAASAVCFEEKVVACDMGGAISCFDARDGSVVWTQRAESNSFRASPAYADGLLVFAGERGDAFCLDASTGRIVWTFRTRSGFRAAPVISGAGVYLPGEDGVLRVVSLATGESVWAFAAGDCIQSSPAIAEGVVVVANCLGDVYCLEVGPR